jgi:DMSO/TMAO reductase YedYZ molybdopterin-dependent catalytic subunit
MEIRTTLRFWVRVFAASAMLLMGAGAAHANPAPPVPLPPAGSVVVFGDVDAPSTFSPEAMRALPNKTVTTTFQTASGAQTHSYTGVPLEAMLTASRPIADDSAEHPLLTVAVVAKGADGYAATLSWAELTTALTSEPALVAWSEDGVQLERPRLVVPEDLKGARFVSDLTTVRVVQLAGPVGDAR